MLRRIRLLGRLGPGGQHLAELSLSRDTAGQHLLVYGYLDSHRVAEMNLATGRLASVTVAQPPLSAPFSAVAW